MAAAALARGTRLLCLTFCMMCLFGSGISNELKEKLRILKEQLWREKQLIESGKANLESQRRSLFKILNENMAKLNCLKKYSTLSASELESVVRYTERTDSRVRGSFVNMAETLDDLELKWEELKESVRFMERMVKLQPDPLRPTCM